MSYVKQNFTDGSVLTAEQLNHIEDALAEFVDRVIAIENADVVSTRVGEVILLSDRWEGEESPYSQVVTIDGVTPYSQVDLKPSIEQLAIFHNKDLAFVTENEDGVVTVFALGDKPINDYVIQVSITEVSV